METLIKLIENTINKMNTNRAKALEAKLIQRSIIMTRIHKLNNQTRDNRVDTNSYLRSIHREVQYLEALYKTI